VGHNNTATSDAGGAWRIDDLASGTYMVRGSKDGFQASEAQATVRPGESSDVRLELLQVLGDAPFVEPTTWSGFIECSVRVGTGGAGGSVGINACDDIGRQDVNNAHDFTRGTPQWFQVELQWESSQLAGSDLSLIVGPEDCTDTDYLRRDGPSPLMYFMDRFELGARGIGDEHGLCSRVFAWTSGDLQHVAGAQVQQEFAGFTHAFYNMVPPKGWLFVVDGTP